MAKQAVRNHVANSQLQHQSTDNNQTKFTLYNLAGREKAYYLVEQHELKIPFGDRTAPAFVEPLEANYQYQVFISRNAKKINGTSESLRFCGVNSQDVGTIYKYKRISGEEYAQLHVPVQQNHESVYAFARANLAQGNLNTAKYAVVSTFDATLCHRNIKALTNHEIANFMQDLDITLFDPNTLQEHTILNAVQVNTQISFLEVIKLLEENRHNIIVNIKDLQDNYQYRGINRLKGSRDIDGNLIKPWLTTQYIDVGQYVGMGSFEINRNTATINMLVKRQVRLVKAEDRTPIIEVAGLLVNDLYTFNNYTIVSDGQINIQSLKIKISSKKAFDLLKASGVISANIFDFRDEHIINFQNLPLVTFDKQYNSIDGLFYELASMKVLLSIIAAHLKQESDVFLPEQLEELKKHYLSKNLYLNLPTTNEYSDLKTALTTGTIDTRISYKIDIGSKDILNFSKLHSANKFLDRMYRAYDIETNGLFQKATFEMALNANIAFRHKSISSRMKITAVDVFMKPIFDDFLGLEDNGSVAAILQKAGANSLVKLLQQKRNSQTITKEEMVAGLTVASGKLENYVETVYRENISPLVFYIGSTGLLPDEMDVKAMTADEIAAKYPNLQFSGDEEERTFFEVANSIISVYAKPEYYSKKVPIAVED
jgi:hypothetical protein